MIGCADGKVVSNNYNGKEGVYSDGLPEIDESIVENIYNNVNTIIGLQAIDKLTLEKYIEKLNDMMNYYDLAISDVRHIIRDKSPNAPVRCKIYAIQQSLENKREKTKTSLRYVKILLNSINKGIAIPDVKKGIKRS